MEKDLAIKNTKFIDNLTKFLMDTKAINITVEGVV